MKNFLKIIITICFLNVIFLLGTSKVNAMKIYIQDTEIELPDAPTLSGYTDYIVYLCSGNSWETNCNTSNYRLAYVNSNYKVDYQPFNNRYVINNNTTGISGVNRIRLYELVNGSWVSRNTSPGTNNFQLDVLYATTIDVYDVPQPDEVLFTAGYGFSNLPPFLNGYKKVTMYPGEVNFLLSGLSKGSIYIDAYPFLTYGGRLSYFVKDVPYQSWDTYIDNYYMAGDYFVRQDFDISTYPGASYVMFSKYFYLEGEDNIEYDFYIPEEMYSSLITATLNNNGGYDYTYEVIDENDEVQEENFSSLDYGLTPTSPLLSDMFSNFSSNTFGLTAIVTAPLNLINTITSSSCTSLDIPLPYVNSTLTLPCMSTIYQNTFGSFFNLYQTITFGIISYWVIVKIFNLVKDFKNPDHDEIEVLDL